MANEVIKVYDTKVNAIANSTTGRIDPVVAITNHSGIISNSEAAIPYYIYNKYFYRFESNEPVIEFHIDWDEGEDNSPEKASIEIIKMKNPAFSAITSHIYTEHKHFFPLIRVKNRSGFLSKWYTNDATHSGTDLNDYSALEDSTLSGGQNEFSIVSEEKTNSDRINSFIPSNLPPIGVLKADKKRIYSGIDNDAILSSYTYPLFYTYSTSTSSTKPNIVFTIQDNNGATRKHTLDNSSTNYILSTTGSWTNEGSSSKLAVNCIPSDNYKATDSAPEEHKIIMHGTAVPGTSPTVNDDVAWTSDTGSGNKYLDVHYEAADTADANGNYHCRFFWWGSSSGEGYPTGATLPDGYSTVKVPLPVGDAEVHIMGNLRTAMEDFLGQTASTPTLIVGPTVVPNNPAQYDQAFSYVVDGEGPCTNPSANNISSTYMLFTVVTDSTTAVTTTTFVKKLLRVELVNAKLLSDTDRVYVKVFDAGIGLSGSPSSTGDSTTAVLSNGNPIVDLSDSLTVVYLDGTESRTRASDIDISTFIFDTDKLLTTQTANITEVSDKFSGTFSSIGTKEQSYSLSNIGDTQDSDGRFYDFYRLCRLQVEDDMVDLTTSAAKDALTHSAIEHNAHNTYTSTAVSMPSGLETRSLLLLSNRDTEVTATWTNVATRNATLGEEIMGSAVGTANGTYVMHDSSNLTDHPKSHLFMVRTDKFDRVFFRMNNNNAVGAAMPDVSISAYYANGSTWAPLEIIDETQGLKTSGSIKFTMPSDWKKGVYTDIDSGDWDGPIEEDGNEGTAVAPKDLWTSGNFPSGAYGLIISFTVKAASDNNRNLKCMNIWPYNNSHSQLIKVMDSHHVSLNSIGIAQSVSFGRKSKVISVEDKFGKADVRKIGASGGPITFGGIDLGESTNSRKIMVGYQKNATPVFLDITHRNDEITRFFGVVISLTEDHPTGNMFPKWAVSMQISHIIELSSAGVLSSDKISIGGPLIDDGKYLL